MGGNGKPRWKISFHRNSNSSSSKHQSKDPPLEFLCPISNSLIAEPVVVTSGHTFESISVQVCKDLGFSPTLKDGSTPDFSTVIPNLALKFTISNWCLNSGVDKPHPPDYSSIENLIRTMMTSSRRDNNDSVSELLNAVPDNPQVLSSHAVTELSPRVNSFLPSSSSESAIATPLPLTTRPTCYDDDDQIENPNCSVSEESEKLTVKLKSNEACEQEEAVISLRNLTKTREDTRISLSTPELLSSLKSLISSENPLIQVNAVASVVNLSLAKSNKVKIVRSGFIIPLIETLASGFPEAKDHAAGAIFSLALEDENKMAIGVLGAMEALMNALRCESERTRHDSALALYHLTLVQSNRVKLVKLGVVPTLLTMVKEGGDDEDLRCRVLMILCNVAAGTEGRTAMLDANAVEILVGVLREAVEAAKTAAEYCVAALYGVSGGGMRFRILAKEAKAVEVLREVEERGTERAKEKARRMLQKMRGEEDDEGDGFGPGRVLGRTRARGWGGSGRDVNASNTATF